MLDELGVPAVRVRVRADARLARGAVHVREARVQAVRGIGVPAERLEPRLGRERGVRPAVRLVRRSDDATGPGSVRRGLLRPGPGRRVPIPGPPPLRRLPAEKHRLHPEPVVFRQLVRLHVHPRDVLRRQRPLPDARGGPRQTRRPVRPILPPARARALLPKDDHRVQRLPRGVHGPRELVAVHPCWPPSAVQRRDGAGSDRDGVSSDDAPGGGPRRRPPELRRDGVPVRAARVAGVRRGRERSHRRQGKEKVEAGGVRGEAGEVRQERGKSVREVRRGGRRKRRVRRREADRGGARRVDVRFTLHHSGSRGGVVAEYYRSGYRLH